MLKKYLPLLLLCTAPVFAKPVLTVYTYDSFAADWGPGPVVKKAFEADCNCELKMVALEDGVSTSSNILILSIHALSRLPMSRKLKN